MPEPVHHELMAPPEQLVALMATLLAGFKTMAGKYHEVEGVAEEAWDIYDSVFAEGEKRFKDEEEKDGEEKV